VVERRTVTVVFCDVVGSTALGESVDPEALRGLLARYFERMKAIVERHGGTVEKFIGDAVMAVLGVPVAHEDDALRAVRATGAAEPGEVLIGESTLALVRDAVDVEPSAPLVLKGKAEPVPAYRLVRVHAAPERQDGAHFVGRERELALIRDAFQRAERERRCELVTIAGEAGVGKSRLAAEALASVEARVVRGRCLPYGDGITYWPVVEVLKQLGVMPPEEGAVEAIRALLGETDARTSAEEIAWAFRKTLEHAARERPLVVLFDDIQWGEGAFHDLIEHVALLSSDAPVLLVCLARPELSERRPSWPMALRLGPLGEDDVERLIPAWVSHGLRERIMRAAGGNPLFVGEMLAIADPGDSELVVPPTLQALLAARLDLLEPRERSVLQRGAVEGEIFHRGAVQALAPDEPQLTPRLAALVRKGLVRRDMAQIAGEDGFRFQHLLIRDAAYAALPKTERAELHERLAAWVDQHGSALVELDEILGYHLEQSIRYRHELGLPVMEALADAARGHLAAAGRRALLRQDFVAAASLLERAAALTPPELIDLRLEVDLVDALFWGDRGGDARARADSLAERAAAARDRVAELCGQIQAGELRTFLEPEGATEKVSALLKRALPELEAGGDHVSLYVAYRALSMVGNMHAQFDAVLDACARAAAHSRLAGCVDQLLVYFCLGLFYGSTPFSEVLAWQDSRDRRERRDWVLRMCRAEALAMLARFDEARAIIAELRAELADRDSRLLIAHVDGEGATAVELLAGDPAAAVAAGERACSFYRELDQLSWLSTVAGRVARAYCELGKLEQADTWAGRAAEAGATDDAITQMLWRQARAKVHARRGEHTPAERLAREAVEIGDATQMPNAQADAYFDLAEVLALADRPREAAEALEEALSRYDRKQNLVMAARTRKVSSNSS
jgi:tetratricopeptide (TPR) repeat protein